MKADKRAIVEQVMACRPAPYVPWNCSFTLEAKQKLQDHYGCADIDRAIGNHFLKLGNTIGLFEQIDAHLYRDNFGVVWDRTHDKDIGVVSGCVLPEPTLDDYTFPDPHDTRFFADIEARIAAAPDLYRRYAIGFSLFERAWTLRGMENLMMDFIEEPDFVHALLQRIADYNIAQVEKALTYDIDCVYFGDDWGQQHGLVMGPRLWREFIHPQLQRMYAVVKKAGKRVFIHSCGDVDELFDELIGIGVDCFNPFQPEVMDVHALLRQYRGRLCFNGGLSTQRTLPYGSVADVRRETEQLLAAGAAGGYIFAPAHAVEGDVPLENMLAFIEILQAQPGYA
jgi:uroporphyrinogen decarboxylase